MDEALSVGDIFFQTKCYKKFDEFQKSGMTIPKALAELKTKQVRFTDSVAQDEMPAYVRAQLGIG